MRPFLPVSAAAAILTLAPLTGAAGADEPVKMVFGFEIAELPGLLKSRSEAYVVGKRWTGGGVKSGWRFKDQADLEVADGYDGEITVYWIRRSASRDYPVFHCTPGNATQGRHARLFAFDEHGRAGLGGARMACPGGNWSGYEHLLVDVTSTGREVTLEFYAVDQAGKVASTRLFVVPAGKTVTCHYNLGEQARAGGVDLAKIKSCHLEVTGVGGKTDVMVDNVRLVAESALKGKTSTYPAAVERPGRVLSPEQETLLAELKSCRERIVFQSRNCRKQAGYWHHAGPDETWEIHIINADGTGRRDLTNTRNVHEVVPRASPDGSKIAYAAYTVKLVRGRRQTRSAIYVMDTDGGNKRPIANDAQHPAWTPDGACVTYTKNVRRDPSIFGVKGIYNHNLATGKETRVCDVLGGMNVCWLPDGRHVYAWNKYPGRRGAGKGGVYDTRDKRLVRLPLSGCRADFAPDGKRVISNWVDSVTGWTSYERQPDGGFKAGKGGTQLIFSGGNHNLGIPYFGDWSPDSKYIAFSVGSGGWTTLIGGDWDIFVSRADLPGGKVSKRDEPVHVRITFDQQVANREPDWVPAAR